MRQKSLPSPSFKRIFYMKSGPVSISDIARALNVSASTVSRALKNHPDISLKTRRRVQEYAEQVHYRPNVLALGLKKQQSNTLGVIIPEIVHHFFLIHHQWS